MSSADELHQAVFAALRTTGLEGDIYNFGLLGKLSKSTDPDILERIVNARQVVREHLAEENLLNVIEPFDPSNFNRNASLGENLVFGVAAGESLSTRGLASDDFLEQSLALKDWKNP